MTRFYAFFFLCLLIPACQSIHPPIDSRPSATGLQFKSLSALNLNEDRIHLSTHNDEILLLLDIYEQRDDQFFIKIEEPREFVFDTTHRTHVLHSTFKADAIQPEWFIVITLIELDNEGPVNTAIRPMEKYWREGNFLKKINRSEIDSLLNYDDFLGMHYLRAADLKLGEQKTLIFKGLQIFDRYEYHLIVEGL